MNEERRRAILEICKEYGHEAIGHGALIGILKTLGIQTAEKEIIGDIRYLEGKGLIEVEEISSRKLNVIRSLAKLTPYGIDYLEGNTEAIPGIAEMM